VTRRRGFGAHAHRFAGAVACDAVAAMADIAVKLTGEVTGMERPMRVAPDYASDLGDNREAFVHPRFSHSLPNAAQAFAHPAHSAGHLRALSGAPSRTVSRSRFKPRALGTRVTALMLVTCLTIG
jgi:hypothetical protein